MLSKGMTMNKQLMLPGDQKRSRGEFHHFCPKSGLWARSPLMRSTRSREYHAITLLLGVVITLFALDAKAGPQEELAACRQKIDSLDQRIVELFQQRARVVEEVGKIKREAHLPVAVPSREQQVIAKAEELAKGGPLPAEAVGRIYQKLVEEMRTWEERSRTR